MKTIKITEEQWQTLSEYKIWGKCQSFSETIAWMDNALQTFLPKDHIWKNSKE